MLQGGVPGQRWWEGLSLQLRNCSREIPRLEPQHPAMGEEERQLPKANRAMAHLPEPGGRADCNRQGCCYFHADLGRTRLSPCAGLGCRGCSVRMLREDALCKGCSVQSATWGPCTWSPAWRGLTLRLLWAVIGEA